ncbi:MAG: hypothetical protein M3016_10950 [Actinomycetota bacterium]|nr:hypothetical protein [Actinomycetota bacterium]
MKRPRLRSGPGALIVLVAVAACGSGALSLGQLRTQAGRICSVTARRTTRISAPNSPQDGARFISGGIGALAHELAALRGLPADDDHYQQALRATAKEVTALRFALAGLHAGNDPVVAIKTLEQRLLPLERRADGAWRALRIPTCVAR